MMKRFLIIFRDHNKSVIVQAPTRDDAMGCVIGKIDSCEEVSENFHLFM